MGDAGTTRPRLLSMIAVVVLVGVVAAVFYALGRHAVDPEQPTSVSSAGSPGSTEDKYLIPGSTTRVRPGAPQNVQLRTTGYSFQDNTPKNSDTISGSTIHSVAAGVGTYDDPITVAVPGHHGESFQIPVGTRIYYKDFQFYGIVEDSGATKFSGALHTDIWVDGRGYKTKQSKKCMDPVTKKSVDAILNPPPGLASRPPGPITEGNRCNVAGEGDS